MSVFEFKLPDIGEGVMEGEIVGWLVQEGQSVREDEPMVEVMTDKATVTIGAPKTGTVQSLRAGVGQVVAVGSVIVTLDTGGAGSNGGGTTKHAAPPPPEPLPAAAKQKDDGPAATAVGDIKDSLPGTSAFARPAPAPKAAPAPTTDHFDERPLATPATRRLARERDVDLRYVRGTGPGGRVTKGDVEAFERTSETAPTSVGTTAPSVERPTTSVAPISIEAPSMHEQALEERKPFVGVRRKIAERMQRTKNTAAHFTFVEECDVGKLKELRARLQPAAQAHGVKLSFLPFIAKACVAALKKHPVLNSALDESTNELVYRRYVNLGIAAATDQGLMVPVIKRADTKSVLEIAKEIDRLAEAARSGSIARDELTGSTFTITSLGKTGGLFATPILNMPEVGILGVHQIKQRPVVRDGQIVIGEIMLLSLSFDHRLVDGHVGAAFAYDIIAYLEDPDRLFLET
ncbi:MAG: dihydrolipoamide acetyltransferase family protein [Sandaracinaceae bacterium]